MGFYGNAFHTTAFKWFTYINSCLVNMDTLLPPKSFIMGAVLDNNTKMYAEKFVMDY